MMGDHYGDLREEHYAQQRAKEAQKRADELKKRLAETKAENPGLGVLGASSYSAIGICSACGYVVYELPNWGCRELLCPHKPS